MNGTDDDDLCAVQSLGRQHSGLRHGGSSVVHGRVGHLQTCQLCDHRLVFIDGLEDTLTDFGLVWGVGRIKLGTRNNMPHHGGYIMIVGPGTPQDNRGNNIPGGFILHQS